jgi:hypothetical protein
VLPTLPLQLGYGRSTSDGGSSTFHSSNDSVVPRSSQMRHSLRLGKGGHHRVVRLDGFVTGSDGQAHGLRLS